MRAYFEHLHLQTEEQSFKAVDRITDELKFEWHYHPEFELTYFYAGEGTRMVGDDIAHYDGEDLALLGPNLPHAWYTEPYNDDDPVTHKTVVIQFPEDFWGETFLSLPEVQQIKWLLKNADRGLSFGPDTQKRVAPNLFALTKAEGLERVTLLLQVLQLLSEAEDLHSLASAEYRPTLNENNESRMDLVCNYIHKHYRRTLSLSEVADVASMADSSFSRFFRKMTGRTFIEYVNNLRIGWACKQLVEKEEASVADIAFDSGFNSLSNFNRSFLRHKSMTPREYRKSFLKHAPI